MGTLNQILALLKTAIANGKVQFQSSTGPDLLDTNNNELIKGNTTASAVNQLDTTNAATGGHPTLSTSGGDTDISMIVSAKGAGAIVVDDLIVIKKSKATITTAGVGTYTAAQILGGIIYRDCNGADRTDTTHTAAQIVAAIPGCKVGSTLELTVRNNGSANTITVAGGSGVTVTGTATIAFGKTRRFQLLVTNVTSSSEAVELIDLTN